MNNTLLSGSLFLLVAAAAVLWSPTPQPRTQEPMPTAQFEGARMLGRLPVAFVPNLGQWDHDARYVAKVGAMTVFLQERGWSFTMVEREGERKPKGKEERRELWRDDAAARGVAVRMTFVGAAAPELVAEQPLAGRAWGVPLPILATASLMGYRLLTRCLWLGHAPFPFTGFSASSALDSRSSPDSTRHHLS